METLSRSLQAAVDDMPPTTIDLEHLISRETRARRWRQAGWSAAGAAGAVLAVTGGAVLLVPVFQTPHQPAAAGNTPCPAVRPVPTSSDQPGYDGIPRGAAPEPTEPEAEAVRRLSAALTEALAARLPGRAATDGIHPGCGWVQVEPKIYPARYYAIASISDGAGGSGVRLIIMISDKDLPGVDFYEFHETMPDGTVVGHAGGAGQLGARRADGTTVTVIPHGEVATLAELIALAADPSLTLYP
jgi:hypothetical protein